LPGVEQVQVALVSFRNKYNSTDSSHTSTCSCGIQLVQAGFAAGQHQLKFSTDSWQKPPADAPLAQLEV
jgi:hypothetical protein